MPPGGRSRSLVVAVLLLGLSCAALEGADSEVADCEAADCEATALLQLTSPAAAAAGSQATAAVLAAEPLPGRVTVSAGGAFSLDGEEVLLLGGNYVLKASPYFPPVGVVRNDARQLAQGAKEMTFHPRGGKKVLPCVRLGAMWEGSMPNGPGEIDATWAANLEATVKVFAEEGVYVFLDVHQDALSTTNGGEGVPWWLGAEMQKTADPGVAYIVTPEHPLELVIPEVIVEILRTIDVSFPLQVLTMPGDTDPWRAFAVGSGAGEPRNMNVGNVNMRLNNNDQAWQNGTLPFTRQMQNLAHRFWTSPTTPADRKAFFDPFVAHVLYLCRVWELHANVVAVEFVNEPPLGGLPSIGKALYTRNNLFHFYAEVLRALEGASPPTAAPVALEDLFGAVYGSGPLFHFASIVGPQPNDLAKLSEWAHHGRLILSFHYYPGMTTVSLTEMVALAKKEAAYFGKVPIFLSEFWSNSSQGMADTLAAAATAGCDAVTFWQYVDSNYTAEPGWFMYPPETGDPFEHGLTGPSWEAYVKTVQDGTFWGASINGAGGGQSDVLRRVRPQAKPLVVDKAALDGPFPFRKSLAVQQQQRQQPQPQQPPLGRRS